jgi:hypothetical protein
MQHTNRDWSDTTQTPPEHMSNPAAQQHPGTLFVPPRDARFQRADAQIRVHRCFIITYLVALDAA